MAPFSTVQNLHIVEPAGRLTAPSARCARSTLFDLPLLDELRTYCYEHKIEEMPAFFIA